MAKLGQRKKQSVNAAARQLRSRTAIENHLGARVLALDGAGNHKCVRKLELNLRYLCEWSSLLPARKAPVTFALTRVESSKPI